MNIWSGRFCRKFKVVFNEKSEIFFHNIKFQDRGSTLGLLIYTHTFNFLPRLFY